ncbi:streptomycin-6-phosphate phosphatase [Frankia sp. AiPs1]|uniref:streptomycin-6-phosphate phosphatase n=1 Tax=Frankia sp. AiPs1 TaxID=573493 RepID=UPI002044CCBA|nr:streptomycin-6-phosphate phosphatase [Frankia sp. AiPs1]MCM3920409.1 streptomycin-6-phosphate phosphatase [Frankia sp. AiPs1]
MLAGVEQDARWRIGVAWDGEHRYVADVFGWRLTDNPDEARTWPTRLEAVREANAFARARAWRIEYGGAAVAPVPPTDGPDPAMRHLSWRP